MTEISKTSHGLKGLVAPDTVSTEVDIHQDGVTMVKSLCYFCHANCGVLAYVKDGDVIKIEGDPDYSSQGGLCCRGTSALLHVNHPARINHALKRVGEKGEGKWEQIPYDQAIQEVADRLNQIKAESGAEAVASAGGTTRTDDWARRRFLNQFGTPNGFHNALLCWIPTFMAETCVAGWSPFETDLGAAKCLILWGMNPGASTLGGMNGYTDLQKAGLKIIVVDPRYSETASKADLWLPLRPGTDAALALAMLRTIIYEGLYDFDFVNQWCDGFEELQGAREGVHARMGRSHHLARRRPNPSGRPHVRHEPPRLHPVGLHVGPDWPRLHHRQPRHRPHPRHLRQPGRSRRRRHARAFAGLSHRRGDGSQRVPARRAEGQADRL